MTSRECIQRKTDKAWQATHGFILVSWERESEGMDIVELLLLKISVTSSRQLSNALQMRKEVSKGPGRLKKYRKVSDGPWWLHVWLRNTYPKIQQTRITDFEQGWSDEKDQEIRQWLITKSQNRMWKVFSVEASDSLGGGIAVFVHNASFTLRAFR